jgi:phage-related protein
MTWTVLTWSKAVEDEIESLPKDIQARLHRFQIVICAYGPMALPAKHAKSLGGGLWELRLTGRDGIARVIYLTLKDQRVVLLCAFMKKTQKTPLRELELARQRARSLQT